MSAAPDSRDWKPPREMASIFDDLERARRMERRSQELGFDGDGAILRHLLDAVEALAKHVAGDGGSRNP